MRYEVLTYGEMRQEIAPLFSRVSNTNIEEVVAKQQFAFLEDYFQKIEPKTVIVEYDYIDRDFLEDYAAYHVKSFRDYGKKCVRLLFFSLSFSVEDFDHLLSSGNTENQDFLKKFQDEYLGYVVVRPLPRKMIGRTALKTYPKDSTDCERFFPATQYCKSNLFGIPLKVQSLPFQEQDRSVSACATSAVWSVLHKTASLFNHSTLSPVAVTKAAMQGIPISGRIFPNSGLTANQISNALRSVGLEAQYTGFQDFSTEKHVLDFKEQVYAYLQAGIPLILGFDLYAQDSKQSWSKRGHHAVAIAGYGMSKEPYLYAPSSKDFPRLAAHRIKKLYVHDDQTGPFSNMEFFDTLNDSLIDASPSTKIATIATSWTSNACKYRAKPAFLTVPLYHKIRIDYADIRRTIFDINQSICNALANTSMRKAMSLSQWRTEYSWNISLSNVNDMKKEMFENRTISSQERKGFLECSLPRFFWRCSIECQGSPVLEFLFDATDVTSGDLFVHRIEYDETFSTWLKYWLKNIAINSISSNNPLARTFQLIVGDHSK